MLTLVNAQVWKYKSIEDSTLVDIAEDVTVLVGKNESGKTGFLEALHKSMPLGTAKFNYVEDYPRREMFNYRKRHDSKDFSDVVELTFQIEKELADKINKHLFNGEVVIQEGSKLTRTTNMNNESRIGFSVPQAKAIAALGKPFLATEAGKQVFENATNFEKVLDSIESLGLPADDLLAKFAAVWRSLKDKFPKWDYISGHVWTSYLAPALPSFLYFDDYRLLSGKINLPSLLSRIANKQMTDADETVQGLLQLAEIDAAELTSDDGYETSKVRLEAISLSITEKIFDFWKQNKELDVEFDIRTDAKDVAPFNNGPNLYIRIKNRRHGVTVPFDQRSKGFIWFFSFLVWFDSVASRSKTTKPLILLLDEPGLNLHALAQSDFLQYIDNLAEDHQIIFTTHSPFMVDSAKLNNVRVVEDVLKEGTKVSSDLAGSSEESVFPLQAALGYSIAQNLFISKKNLLVEGPADLILLHHVATLLESQGKRGLDNITLVPVGGLDKLATFIALLGASKLEIAVLHDKAKNPHQKLEELVQQKLIGKKRVLDFSMFLDGAPTEADLEDLLPQDLYIEAFNEVYNKELQGTVLKADELLPHPRIVERINLWLKEKKISLTTGGGYNHYRVAQGVQGKLTDANLSAADLAPFERIFIRLQEVL